MKQKRDSGILRPQGTLQDLADRKVSCELTKLTRLILSQSRFDWEVSEGEEMWDSKITDTYLSSTVF